MKILNRIAATACLFGAVLLVSCESPDLSTAHESQVNGLLNVTIQIPDNPTEFYATKKGPYEEGEEITVKVPTTDEDPLDVSRLICTVSVEHNCYVVPGVGGEMDFTEPYKITVIDALGNRHNNTIRVVPTPPKTKFSKVWEKNCTDLGLASRNNTGLAIYGQYLAVQEYNGPIYLYDMKTGAAVKTIDAARSFMMKARTDDAGHLITSRENIYGAGFMVFYYSEADQEHKLLLDYTAGDGCPGDLGYNMSVAGDVTSGTAYIYGTGPNDMTIYYWKLQDGQLVTPANQPNKLRYGPAGSSWTAAPAIQRASLADDSDHYISYTKWVNGNSDEALKSRFNIFTTSMEVTALNAAAHEYRLLGFNVFKVEMIPIWHSMTKVLTNGPVVVPPSRYSTLPIPLRWNWDRTMTDMVTSVYLQAICPHGVRITLAGETLLSTKKQPQPDMMCTLQPLLLALIYHSLL